MRSTVIDLATAPGEGRGLQSVLVAKGLLDEDQIRRARRIWDRLEEKSAFGALLIEMGLISREQLDSALSQLKETLSPAEILVESGHVGADLVGKAGLEAREKQVSVEQHLIAMRTVSEELLLQAGAFKYGVESIALDAALVDMEAYRSQPTQAWRRLQALPVLGAAEDGEAAVVEITPKLVDDLRALLKRNIAPRLCAASAMAATLQELESRAAAARGSKSGHISGGRADTPEADDLKAVQLVDHLIQRAVKDRASDIHIEPMEQRVRVRFRVDGALVNVMDLGTDQGPRVAGRLKVLAGCDIAEKRRHQDGRFVYNFASSSVDIRVSTYVSMFGETIVMRLLDKKVGLVGLERLGFAPPMLRDLVDRVLSTPDGFVLVTGPTGSGKTTTLFNAIDYCNDTAVKIISAEEPVEYVLNGVIQYSHKEKTGSSLVDSLRAILRQDPDIIVVGEIRDRATAEIAIQAALSGHKVYSTFHTEDTVGAMVRLVDMGIEPFLVASTARGILAQRLLRRNCQACIEEVAPPAGELRILGITPRDMAGIMLKRGRGCADCHMTGYRGRVGVYELLAVNESIREAVLSRAATHEIAKITLTIPSFVTLTEDAVMKAVTGQTTLAEVIRKTPRSQIRPVRQLMEKLP